MQQNSKTQKLTKNLKLKYDKTKKNKQKCENPKKKL